MSSPGDRLNAVKLNAMKLNAMKLNAMKLNACLNQARVEQKEMPKRRYHVKVTPGGSDFLHPRTNWST